MNVFDEFASMVDKSLELDEWVRNKGLRGYLEELKKEVDETDEAARKNDLKNLKEELGDILYDWLHACKIAEHSKMFTVGEVVASALNKLNRRKPYLAENRRVTSEEAVAIWKKVKEEEKAHGIR